MADISGKLYLIIFFGILFLILLLVYLIFILPGK